MIKKRMGWIFTSALLLVGCTSPVASVQEEINAAATAKEAIVGALNTIQTEESQVQTSFDESITENEELVNFKDGTASVFTNIESRRESLSLLTDELAELETTMTDLAAFEEEELPLDKMATFTDTISELEASLNTYQTSYEEQLNREEDIFQSFGAEEADFNVLYDGVTELNNQSDANVDVLRPLHELLDQFDTQANELANDLDALAEE